VKKNAKSSTDPLLAQITALRALAVPPFIEGARSPWALPITSINEDKLLRVLGVSRLVRDQIEGLQSGRNDGSLLNLDEQQLSSQAVVRLAADPSMEVGQMQRRTTTRLVRRVFARIRTAVTCTCIL
jgi:hypothetical protein